MSDAAVLRLAAGHLRREAELDPGSAERAITGMKFDSAMAEMNRRGARHVLAQIRTRREAQ